MYALLDVVMLCLANRLIDLKWRNISQMCFLQIIHIHRPKFNNAAFIPVLRCFIIWVFCKNQEIKFAFATIKPDNSNAWLIM